MDTTPLHVLYSLLTSSPTNLLHFHITNLTIHVGDYQTCKSFVLHYVAQLLHLTVSMLFLWSTQELFHTTLCRYHSKDLSILDWWKKTKPTSHMLIFSTQIGQVICWILAVDCIFPFNSLCILPHNWSSSRFRIVFFQIKSLFYHHNSMLRYLYMEPSIRSGPSLLTPHEFVMRRQRISLPLSMRTAHEHELSPSS